jgi:hypothetical protein
LGSYLGRLSLSLKGSLLLEQTPLCSFLCRLLFPHSSRGGLFLHALSEQGSPKAKLLTALFR